jgi:type IV pilus assembly protein PilC
MKFKYQAKTKEGELQVGFVDAGSKDSAVNILSSHDLFILKLEMSDTVHWYDRLSSYFTGIKREDMVVMTRQFATLLEARLPLSKALTTLQEQTQNPTLRESVRRIQEDIDSGLSLSQALERQPEVFSTFFISMIRSAEVTGNMEQVSKFLADYTEREAALISKTRSAMIYPGIVLGLFSLVGILMITVVFPQIEPVFSQSGVPLPIITQIFLGSGKFILSYWIPIVLVLAIMLAMILEYLQTPEGRALRDDMKVRLPVLRKVFLPVTATRFANASAMLLKGGVPITQAMEIVGETLDNALYRDLLHEVSERLGQGTPLSQALAEHPDYFPPLVSQMLAVGETTGQVDEMFMRIGNFYSREADNIVNNLVELIQPILMIGIGLMVGLLFAAILLPLYKLTSAIQ